MTPKKNSLMLKSVSLLAASTLSTAAAKARNGPRTVIGKDVKDRYDTGLPWTTLKDGTEFQPASSEMSPLAQEHLRRLTGETTGSNDFMGKEESPYYKLFVDGAETYYDEYAQAWRALGWYIDCDYCDPYYGSCWWQTSNNNEEDEHDQGDQDEDPDVADEGDRYAALNQGCRRFLLWAAYVDENYSGNGIGEYQYFDRQSNSWDDTACKYGKSTRCVKMDCHLPESHFTLLGFFREPNYDDWMDQLFKHQGDCVWSDTEYRFMQGDRQAWPEGCQDTIFTDESTGNTIRYAIKPTRYGGMSLGLYTDTGCVEEYKGRKTVEEVMREMVCGGYVHLYLRDDYYYEQRQNVTATMCQTGNTDFLYYFNTVYNTTSSGNNDDEEDQDRIRDDIVNNIWSLDDHLKAWNAAFDVFKQCQPCKTYDLTNVVAGKGYTKNGNGDRYKYNSAYRYQGSSYNENDETADDDYYDDTFHCHDDADYNNVNQCMKFAYKTQMMTATYQDVELAGNQGTITKVYVPGINTRDKVAFGKGLYDRSNDQTSALLSGITLAASFVLFVHALWKYRNAREEWKANAEPLLRTPYPTEAQYPPREALITIS